MISILTKNYTPESLDVLSAILENGCEMCLPCKTENATKNCSQCDCKYLCDDINRVQKFINKKIIKDEALDCTMVVTTENEIQQPIVVNKKGLTLDLLLDK